MEQDKFTKLVQSFHKFLIRKHCLMSFVDGYYNGKRIMVKPGQVADLGIYYSQCEPQYWIHLAFEWKDINYWTEINRLWVIEYQILRIKYEIDK